MSGYNGVSKMKKSNNPYGFPDMLNLEGYSLEGRDMGIYMRYESNWNVTSSDEPKIIVDISPYAGRIMAQYSILDDNEVTFSDYKVVENMDEAEKVLNDFHSQSGMKKMKKSSIHDMIAQCRDNNNSLVKSRVSITKEPYNNNEIEECLKRLKNAKYLVEDVDEFVFQTTSDKELLNILERIQSDIDSVVDKLESMKRA